MFYVYCNKHWKKKKIMKLLAECLNNAIRDFKMEHAIIHLDMVIDAFTLLYLSPLRYSIVYNKNIKYLFIKKIV